MLKAIFPVLVCATPFFFPKLFTNTPTAFPIVAYCSYALGSILAAVWVCKLFALPDPRTVGSLNPGSTNVSRLNHRGATLLTFFADFSKGLLPFVFAQIIGFDLHHAAFCGLCAVLGHTFPAYGSGGRGVATTLGFLAAYSPTLALSSLVTWCAMVAFFGKEYIGLSSLLNTLLTFLFFLMSAPTLPLTLLFSIACMIVLKKHALYIPKYYAKFARSEKV